MAYNAHAQDEPPVPPEPTPIDGGVSVLIGAAVIYGYKKYRNYKSKNNDEQDPDV